VELINLEKGDQLFYAFDLEDKFALLLEREEK
jgi:hypothetical protein